MDNLYALSEAEIAARGIATMPPTLMHATAELTKDDVLRAALGPGRDGGDYIDYFAKVKREEFAAYHAEVSRWETDRYLTLF